MARAARGIGRAAGMNDWTRALNGQPLPEPKYLTPKHVVQLLQVTLARLRLELTHTCVLWNWSVNDLTMGDRPDLPP